MRQACFEMRQRGATSWGGRWELGARGGVGAGGGTCTRDAFMHRIRHSEEAFDNFSTRNCFRNLKTLHVTFDDGADAEGLPAVWPTLREI